MTTSGEVDEDKRATLRRFAALGASGPLAHLAGGDDRDDTEARSAIAGYLTAHPGSHFSKIRDELGLGTGETQHHLRTLVDDGRVERVADGDYRRFYPAGRYSAFEKRALGYLRRETPRGMLVELLRDPSAGVAALADRLGVSTATVSAHAGELEAAGLLDRSDGYRLTAPETVLVLVVRHADSLGPAAVDLADEADELVSVDR
ncbi:MAG: winged helix-turn-helix transcriptional regulator [Halobacteriaceae archaeon]